MNLSEFSVGMRARYNRLNKFWLRYKKNRAAVAGLLILIFFTLIALLAPLISPHNPLKIEGKALLKPPSAVYIMGTDDLGRDVLSRTLYGSRVSLFVGCLAAVASTSIGILVGAVSGYYGGRTDTLLMRITELFQVIPQFFLLLIIVAVFGPGIWNVILAIGILSWPSAGRLVRSEFMRLRESEFVEAARALGDNDARIIFDEILLNAFTPIIVSASFQVASAILLEASMSFLGLGDPEIISWGIMLYYGRNFLRSAWWMTVFPGLALLLVSLGFNLVGDGLNDALNPRLKER